MNPLYQQFQGSTGNNPMIQKLMEFKKNFSGDPEQMVKSLLNSGKVSQAQLNQYVQQANEIYKLMK